jgi:hypothetical protein
MSEYKFIEDGHLYSTSDDREMISVSKFTDLFKPKVDWNEIARKSAAKLSKQGTPTTKEDILAKWALKRDKSAEAGTRLHELREAQLVEQKEETFYNTLCKTVSCTHQGDYKYSIPLQLENNHVYPELMICDEDYMICGQSDKVIVVNKHIHIWDYKTDQEIPMVGWRSEWVAVRKMLPPIDHIDDCKGMHYALKMSLYMYLLWKANKGTLKPGNLVIEHIPLKRDDEGLPILDVTGGPILQGPTKKLQLPYLKKEVVAMLKTSKK